MIKELNDNSADGRPPISTYLLTNVLDRVEDGVFVFDHQKRLLFTNHLAGELQSKYLPVRLGSRCCEMFWQTGEDESCVVDRSLRNDLKLEVEMPENAIGIPLLITVLPFPINDESHHHGALVLARDISALRSAEAEAFAQKSFMANLADRSPDEIYALDKLGRITWVNQRAATGNPLMLIGQRLIDFISINSRRTISNSITLALDGNDSQAEVMAVRPDESERDVEANFAPLWKEGEVDGVIVFLRDITERKRTQELVSQADKLRAVGELAAGVAHNLNNSLTVIKGRAQLLQMKLADQSSLKSLQVINVAVEDGGKTLRRILEFARRDSVHGFGTIDLDDLITSSTEIARPKWQTRSGHSPIEMKIDCHGPIYVKGDRAELREVVLNLIFNAVDAMPQGGSIEVGTRAELESGCFWVADTGCGMAPETMARIFEPFFTTKGAKGTGLGLSASHGIISRHGGEIIVISEPGEGTRFEVRLPISDVRSRSIKSEEGQELISS